MAILKRRAVLAQWLYVHKGFSNGAVFSRVVDGMMLRPIWGYNAPNSRAANTKTIPHNICFGSDFSVLGVA